MHVLRVLELLQEHLTEAVCQAAFARARTRERQRDGSLWALVQFQFWVSVILRAPVSLTQALEEVREGHDSLAAQIDTSPEAFFQRCKGLSPKFFAEVFRVFIARLREQVPPRYARSLHGLRERYADVLLIDGSRLASILCGQSQRHRDAGVRGGSGVCRVDCRTSLWSNAMKCAVEGDSARPAASGRRSRKCREAPN